MKQFLAWCLVLIAAAGAARAADNEAPEGFTLLFNGKDFTNWNGRNPGVDPVTYSRKMTDAERQEQAEKDLADLQEHWKVEEGQLVNDGHGAYATTEKDYDDFELYVSWKLIPGGDSGVYLKATPQVQVWDYTDESKFNLGSDKGSGGLWNNPAGSPGKDPSERADKPIGEWNTFRIIQVGARTSVYLNDKLVVDHSLLNNYWKDKFREGLPETFALNQATPLVAAGPVQLQTHGNEVRWKNIYIREIPAEEANAILAAHGDSGFQSLFDGESLEGWDGADENYEVVDGTIRCKTGKGGVLYTQDEYKDFVARLEFKLPPGGNNGLAIRYPGEGDPAYVGMCELQVLDNTSDKYASLDPRQAHGSAYGMVPAFRGYQRPVGEWNFQEVTVKGPTVKVELNGNVILEADLSQVKEFMADSPHPGKDLTSGHFGFAGHGDAVEFRNVQIKSLE